MGRKGVEMEEGQGARTPCQGKEGVWRWALAAGHAQERNSLPTTRPETTEEVEPCALMQVREGRLAWPPPSRPHSGLWAAACVAPEAGEPEAGTRTLGPCRHLCSEMAERRDGQVLPKGKVPQPSKGALGQQPRCPDPRGFGSGPLVGGLSLGVVRPFSFTTILKCFLHYEFSEIQVN